VFLSPINYNVDPRGEKQMYKVEYINPQNQVVTETLKDQTQLVSFVATLDRLDCYIKNISTIKGKRIKPL
jgi:hypothetical protein